MTSALQSAPPTIPQLLDVQDQVLGRRQALLGGMSEDAWQWRLDRGRWRSVLPGVAVAHSGEPTDRQRSWAAVLYAGEDSALSADAALVALGMTLAAPDVIHLAVGPEHRVTEQVFRTSQHRVVAHRVTRIDELVHPVRRPAVLRVAPAVLHAAAWAPTDRAAEWRVAAAVQQRLVRPTDVRDALAMLPRLHRRALLTTVLDDVERGAHAGSELRFLRFLRRHGLPAPDRLQRRLRTGTVYYLDAWWERQRVAAELDGAHHRLVGSWEADALRGNDVVISQRHDRVLLLRLTTGNLRHDQLRVADQLRAALA